MLATAASPTLRADAPAARQRPPALEIAWASHQDDVHLAQRLRYRVFVEEMGAKIDVPPGTPPGLDVDRFDDACEHLLVRTPASGDTPAQVVGTYRVLTPAGARRTGGLYTESEFDIRRLDALRPRMAELGRSCTAPEWRRGSVMLLLWSALGEFMERSGLDYMIGCASIPMHDGGLQAAGLWQALRTTHLCDPHLRVLPRRPLAVDDLDVRTTAEPPALIKGYLRCGGKVLGAPAHDPDFGVADLPMMLALSDLPSAYRARFIGH
ncbi:MAG: GNAT family N-acetyltransferase [Burkholderiales bacterium]|nr:GNAT family N-acetyltransferase [Burkholderiales bacterium]